MRDIAPLHEEHWFQIYGKIALTGEPLRFENPAEQLGRFYQVYAFRVGEPAERKVAILFNDITERKRAEAALRQSGAELRWRMAGRYWDAKTDATTTSEESIASSASTLSAVPRFS